MLFFQLFFLVVNVGCKYIVCFGMLLLLLLFQVFFMSEKSVGSVEKNTGSALVHFYSWLSRRHLG